jgi:hypothetical protein
VTTIYKKMGGSIKGNQVRFIMHVSQQKSGQADDQKAPAKLVGEPNPPGFDGRGLATLEVELEGIAGEGDFTKRFPEKNKTDGLIPELKYDADDHQNPKHGPEELAAKAAEKHAVDKGKMSDNEVSDGARDAMAASQKAGKASTATGDQGAMGHAAAAESAGTEHAQAAMHHTNAADAHDDQQKEAMRKGNFGAARAHGDAVDAHRDAADAHGKMTSNVWTDEARQAATEARQKSGGAAAASGKTSGTSGSAGAIGSAKDASTLSKGADSAEDHEQAAGAHQAAAAQHQQAARGGAGATPQGMQAHAQAAQAHTAAAQAHEKAANLKRGMLAAHNQNSDHLQMPPHDASKSAASASVRAEHGPSRQMALTALDHSHDDNSPQAAKYHEKAAEQHEQAATDLRSQGGSDDHASRHDEAGALHRKAASLHSATINARRNPMKLSTTEREGLVNLLAVNCACRPAELKGMTDDKLIGLRKALQKFVANTKAEGSNADVVGGTGTDQAGGAGLKSEHQTAGEDVSKVRNDEEDDEHKKKTDNVTTIQNWLRNNNAPPALVSLINGAVENMNRDKAARVSRIVGNVRNEERRRELFNTYMGKSIEELKQMEELVAPARNSFVIPPELANYLGAGGGPVDNANYLTVEDQDDILPMPTINWQEEVQSRRKQDAV